MINFIEDNLEAPDPLLRDSSGNYTIEVNPEYIQWRNCEQALFTFINSTLSPSISALTVGQKSGRVWKILEKRFASVSRSHSLSLRDELTSLKKGSKSMNTFFQRIKEIRDKLGAVAVVLMRRSLII